VPRVHFVKKARKDNPAVKAGESYYWWKFRYGGKRYSKIRPKPWQLTQSPFLQELYMLEDWLANLNELDEDCRGELVDKLREMQEECENSLYNMPDHLQETSESGQLLQERINYLDEWASAVENIDLESTSPEDALEQAIDANPGIG